MPLFYSKEARIFKTSCGPFDNNSYLVVCPSTGESIIIDAPMGPGEIIEEAKGTHVKAILITHGHKDHLAGLGEIIDATGAPVRVHRDDAKALTISPETMIEDGENIIVGTLEIAAIHTPGHTPGSLCYLVGKHLFSGDTLFPGGPGRSRSPEALLQIIESITDRLYDLSDDTFILPGHGGNTTIGVSKEQYSVFQGKEHPKGLSGDVLWLES